MFLNPLMLAGLGGAVLPLVLHLLNRARYRTVDWGAMMFLPGTNGRQQQSTRLKQLLLLLLRMAIVALIAIALARPLVGTRWAALGVNPHCCAVILVDTSASMGIEDGQGTRLESGRRAALAVLAGLDRSDDVNVLTMPGTDAAPSLVAAELPPTDLQAAVAQIADMHLSPDRADVAAGLSAAAQIFQKNGSPNRLLVIVCDRQAASWKNVTDEFARNWRGGLGRGESQPRVVVIGVGGEETENLAIDRITAPPPPLVRDIPAPIDIVVHNYGRTAANGVPLSLNSASGRTLLQTRVDVPPGAASTITVSPRFGNIGSHVITAKLGSASAAPMPFGDQADAVVTVVDPLKVLVITGEPIVAGDRKQADFIRLALAPYKTAGESGADLATVTTLFASDAWPADLSEYRAVILADVPRVDSAQAHRLEQFVFDGGGLLIAPGKLLRPQAYNDNLFRDGAGLLPAKIADAVELPPSHPENSPSIIAPDAAHPALRFLQGRGEIASDISVRRYLPADAHGSDCRVLATYSNGAPTILERALGRGRSMLVTTTLGSEWSTIPQSSFFLPFVQSAVRYLCGGLHDEQNLTPGQPIVGHFADALGDKAVVVLPDGTRDSVDLTRSGAVQEVRYTATSRAGKYEVRVHTAKGDVAMPFIVQGERDEADPTPLSAEQWARLERSLGFTRIEAQSADLASATAGRRGGREIWLTLVSLAVAMLVAESALSRLWSVEV